jgi:hypothetical protein
MLIPCRWVDRHQYFLHIAAAILGLACLIAAQRLLLESRQPFAPLALYILGFALWLPSLNRYEPNDGAVLDTPHTEKIRNNNLQNRKFYALAAVFFAVIAVLAAQTGRLSLLLLFSWLMSVGLAVRYALAGNSLLPNRFRATSSAADRMRRWEALAVAAFVVLSLVLQMQTPAPATPLPQLEADLEAARAVLAGRVPLIFEGEAGPLFHYLQAVSVGLTRAEQSSLEQLSRLFVLLLVPAVYLLGRTLDNPYTGIVAAGFVSVSGWALALGMSGMVYSALAVVSALYVYGLYLAQRSRSACVWVGILWGIGWLLSPWFWLTFWLLPITAISLWLSERRPFRRTAVGAAAALLVMLVIILPFVLAPRQTVRPPSAPVSGLDPVMKFADGLSSSLLMFNLTSDPSPFHGIVNRPVFSPVLAASFGAGVLLRIRRVHQTHRWSDSLPLVALVVTLLPSGLSDSPDLQRAALALPISIAIAASSIAFLARCLTDHWGRAGLAIALSLFVAALVVIAADARDHYVNTFLPTYENAAQVYRQLPPATP